MLEFVGTSLGDGSIGKPAQTLLDAMEVSPNETKQNLIHSSMRHGMLIYGY